MSANAQNPNTPNNNGSSPKRKTYSEWDWQFSTYYWKIYLDPRHPGNNPNVIFLKGYSKKTGQNEASDKDNLLRRKIFTLCRNKYFDRMIRMEIYQKQGEMLNINTAPHILTIYPGHYDIPEANHDIIFKKHGKWLQDFYYCLKHGKDLTHLMPNARDKNNSVNQDDYLNIHKYDFKSKEALYTHATKLLRYGHPEGVVTHFIREYKLLKQWT